MCVQKTFKTRKILKLPLDFNLIHIPFGDRGGTVVKVLCYKSEGRWFDLSRRQWIFH